MVFSLLDLTIVFASVIFFIMVQSFFWIHVGSKQFENIILDKSEIASNFLKFSDPEVKNYICNSLEKAKKSHTEDEATLQSLNKTLLHELTWPWVLTLTLSSVICVFIKLVMQDTTSSEWASFKFGLMLLIGSFLTELIIFFCIIKPYVLIGDVEILSIIREQDLRYKELMISARQ